MTQYIQKETPKTFNDWFFVDFIWLSIDKYKFYKFKLKISLNTHFVVYKNTPVKSSKNGFDNEKKSGIVFMSCAACAWE